MPRRRTPQSYDDYEYDDYDAFYWYPPSQPIRVEDGIKAKSQRGAFGSSWWAKRWLQALERFGWGSRLERGRTYARKGQVISIDLQAGLVKANVQGSRSTPYKVTIEIPPLADEQWNQVLEPMVRQAIFAARLLSGEMPHDIEEAFHSVGVPLFPQSTRDLITNCSCPDFANPCKHIAAVYYLLGERFDEDPFLIFHLRGRTREQIIAALRSHPASAPVKDPAENPERSRRVRALGEEQETFYQAGAELATIAAAIAIPEIEAAVLRRYGPAPAGTDNDLRALYRAMTAFTLEKVFGEETS